MDTYKAALLTGSKEIEVGELPVPSLNAGEVWIRLQCANLCPTDLKKFYHLDKKSASLLSREIPVVLGHEASGYVVAVAPDVDQIRPGTRVAIDPMIPCFQCAYCKDGDYPLCQNLLGLGVSAGLVEDAIHLLKEKGIGGCFAEFVKVPASQLFVLPDGISYEQAAMVEPLADVLHSVEAGKPIPGETAVVFGLGAMGLMHIRVLSSMGITNLIGVDPLENRREKALTFGASQVVDPGAVDPVGVIRDATKGLGAELIFVCAGGNAQKVCTDQSLKAIRKKGRVLLYASALKPAEMLIDINHIHYGLITLSGTVGFYRRHAEQAIQLLMNGVVDVDQLRTPVFTLDEIAEAFAISGQDDVVKVGIDLR